MQNYSHENMFLIKTFDDGLDSPFVSPAAGLVWSHRKSTAKIKGEAAKNMPIFPSTISPTPIDSPVLDERETVFPVSNKKKTYNGNGKKFSHLHLGGCLSLD